MFFSIIVPVYNAEKYIRNCIDSILNQTFTDFEIVIINDGSQDSTSSILEEYVSLNSRIKIYYFENSGVSISRRRGVSLSGGDYFVFVDSDDTINPNLLEKLYHCISEFKNPDIIRYQANLLGDPTYKDHSRYNISFSLNTVLRGIDALKLWSIPCKKYAVYWIFAFKRSVFSNVLFLPTLKCYEDVALIPILIATSQKVVTIDYVGYNYTCDNTSSITNLEDPEAERARALYFFEAYKYAIDNFIKIPNISTMDIAFFIEDYNKRLRGKYNSLNENLKLELAEQFNITRK